MSALDEAMRFRLLELARQMGVNGERLLARWVMERFLARLGHSGYAPRFILRGGLLLTLWEGELLRSTNGVDLACARRADLDHAAELLRRVIEDLSAIGDGVKFDGAAIRETKAEGSPLGIRLTAPARIGSSRLSLRIHLVPAQPTTPGIESRWYPSLLPGFSPTLVFCQPPETVVAQKLAAVVEFGADGTRMSDYFDLWHVARSRHFCGHALSDALAATFGGRYAGKSILREDGYWQAALADGFATPAKITIWKRWLHDHEPLKIVPAFPQVVRDVRAFGRPLIEAMRMGKQHTRRWSPSRGWSAVRVSGQISAASQPEFPSSVISD